MTKMLLLNSFQVFFFLHHFSLLFLILNFSQPAKGSSTTFIYAGCSPNKFDSTNPFLPNLDSLLNAIVAAGPQASYNSFAAGNNSATPPGDTAFGLYQCRTDLTSGDCSACVQSAVNQLSLVCAASFAGSLQLDGCLVRYSNDDFLGRPDTTVVYKKCSSSTTGDGEFFRRRDDVLADLRNGVSYRVSRSGTVQGYAQCSGDLSPADCAACLTSAVEQLENACGSAVAADMFLAQCYARYWASGYYLPAAAVVESSDDDIGRTVAIILGILAGLAVIVVFISFLKKAC